MSPHIPEPISSHEAPPDPSLASAVGAHHSLATALADLVDNSVDAGADTVQIRFVLEGGIPRGLQVIDNGCGMEAGAVDRAMTYAKKRVYEDDALGHFGIGLKAASLSQADTLLVWSRAASRLPVGRRLQRRTIDSTPIVETFATDVAEQRLQELDLPLEFDTATVAEWWDLRTFLHDEDAEEQAAWLSRTTDTLLAFLGLTFHRLLEQQKLTIVISQMQGGQSGAVRRVAPLDPVPRGHDSAAGFPWKLTLALPKSAVQVDAGMWTKHGALRSSGYKLGGVDPIESQGLYVYRNDRLLHAGGWCGLAVSSPDLIYARLALDVDGLGAHVTINPEKSGVEFDATLKSALQKAVTPDGRSFADFLACARDAGKESRRYQKRPVTLVEPGQGLATSVRDTFEDAVDYVADENPVRFRWSGLGPEEMFRIDIERNEILLNARHRRALGGAGRAKRNDDAPVVKSLLTFLLSDHLKSLQLGSKQRQYLAALQKVLMAAVSEQELQDGTHPEENA